MNKLSLSLITLLFSIFTSFAEDAFEPETLNYKVMYKWGLINKKAGTATITLKHTDSIYHAQLTAASEPWADKIFKVRDTLNCRMSRPDLTPLFYEKIAHEGGEDKYDTVTFDYSTPGITKANTTRQVWKKNKQTVDQQNTLESVCKAVDMLSSFYLMRSMNFSGLIPGYEETFEIFSGKAKETLTIRYHGIDTIELDNNKANAYHIVFIFTSKGGKKTSDDMEAWLSTDAAQTPLKLEGKLPVGKVRCLLVQ